MSKEQVHVFSLMQDQIYHPETILYLNEILPKVIIPIINHYNQDELKQIVENSINKFNVLDSSIKVKTTNENKNIIFKELIAGSIPFVACNIDKYNDNNCSSYSLVKSEFSDIVEYELKDDLSQFIFDNICNNNKQIDY